MTAQYHTAIKVILLDADARYRTLISHHITTAFPHAEITETTTLSDIDESLEIDCFILDHTTLQQAAQSGDQENWFRVAEAIARTPCIVIAEPSDERIAVHYMKGGAKDFLPKRLIKHDLLISALGECIPDAFTPIIEQSLPARQQVETKQASVPSTEFDDDDNTPSERSGTEGYRVKQIIAKGGVASVCLAHSDMLGHDVALKVLRISKSNDANKLYERFEQEYRLISTIDSRAVVKTYAYGRTDVEVFMAFEYFPSGDLRRRIRKRISREQGLDYARQIASALKELHALGIAHRDLKPANVMLRDDDTIALIDFGLAKQLQSTEQLTLPGTVQGTPHYLSPEQAKGKPVDQRSDIYSLGVVLFELLEGRKPYTAKTALDAALAHINEPVPTLSEANSEHQPLLERMMAKEPEQRCVIEDVIEGLR